MAGLPVLGVEATGVGTQAVLVQDGEVVSRFTEGPLNVLLDPSAFDRLAHLIKESGASAAGLGLAGL
ncbi:MAG TPA: ATPase, partial [Acidothermaceae bacterium]|nr:ATPase [Acidothermaceae bacterium]